jgi:hypothetical protein
VREPGTYIKFLGIAKRIDWDYLWRPTNDAGLYYKLMAFRWWLIAAAAISLLIAEKC